MQEGRVLGGPERINGSNGRRSALGLRSKYGG
jgi:hypothetical protein